MTDNEIYTFALDFSQTKLGLAAHYLSEAHKLQENPYFSEVSQKISCYPPSSAPETDFNPIPYPIARGSTSARVLNRSPYPEQDRSKESTFKATINPSSGKENQKLPLAQKLANLHRSKREKTVCREPNKRNGEIKQAIKLSHTSAPNYHQSKPSIPIESRFKYESSRLEEIEKTRRVQENGQVAQWSFKPAVSKKDLNNPAPCSKRVEEVQIDKLRNSTHLKQKNEINLTFQPLINEKSINLSNQIKLNISSITSTKSLSRSSSCKQISSISQDLATLKLSKREMHRGNEFLDRQSKCRQIAEESLRRKVGDKEKEFNFIPVINKTSLILVETSNSPQTFEQKVRRLSDGNLDKVKKIEMVREKFYSQFSYSPEINKKSQKIGGASSIERLTQTNKEKLNAKRVEEFRIQDLRSCRFYENFKGGRKFSYVKSCYGQGSDISANIESNLNEKANKSREIKNKRDYEELKNCSFKPEVNSEVFQFGNLKTVKGLGRYFELKEMAKRMTKEKYERELKVFSKRPPANYTSRN